MKTGNFFLAMTIEIVFKIVSNKVAAALAHDPDAASHVPADLWREDPF